MVVMAACDGKPAAVIARRRWQTSLPAELQASSPAAVAMATVVATERLRMSEIGTRGDRAYWPIRRALAPARPVSALATLP